MQSLGHIRILHLADLHCTNNVRPAVGNWWETAIRSTAGASGYDAIVFSGDVAQAAKKPDVFASNIKHGFDYLARLWILASAAGADTPTAPLVLTPGNHDVVRPPLFMESKDRIVTRFRQFVEQCTRLGPRAVIPRSIDPGREQSHAVVTKGATQLQLFPLCSTWFSGEVPPDYIDLPGKAAALRTKTEAVLRTLDTADALLGLLALQDEWQRDLEDILKTDIPYVADDDCEYLKAHPVSGDADTAVIRIAVSHHPLWPIPYEQDEGSAFDIPTNGMRVAHGLHHAKVGIVLHGHKHYMGCSLLNGVRTRNREVANDFGEMLSLCGGQLCHINAGDFGFQAIDIDCLEQGRFNVTVTDYNRTHRTGSTALRLVIEARRHVVGAPLQETTGYKPRWICVEGLHEKESANGDSRSKWHMRRGVLEELGIMTLISAVERKWAGSNLCLPAPADLAHMDVPRACLNEADRFVRIGIDSLREFAELGDRGVDEDFVEELTRRANDKESLAMVFVDKRGNGTWGRPVLIANAAALFKVYLGLNEKLLTPMANGRRGWRHSLRPVEQALQKIGMDNAADDSLPLRFDLARILVWERDALCSPSALVLMRLHRVFNVPLFFVDVSRLPSEVRSSVNDMHLEWTDPTGQPTIGMRYDEATDTRRRTDQRVCDNDWNTVQTLLDYAESPSVVAQEQLHWLLGEVEAQP